MICLTHEIARLRYPTFTDSSQPNKFTGCVKAGGAFLWPRNVMEYGMLNHFILMTRLTSSIWLLQIDETRTFISRYGSH
jgi:hypothetical protein